MGKGGSRRLRPQLARLPLLLDAVHEADAGSDERQQVCAVEASLLRPRRSEALVGHQRFLDEVTRLQALNAATDTSAPVKMNHPKDAFGAEDAREVDAAEADQPRERAEDARTVSRRTPCSVRRLATYAVRLDRAGDAVAGRDRRVGCFALVGLVGNVGSTVPTGYAICISRSSSGKTAGDGVARSHAPEQMQRAFARARMRGLIDGPSAIWRHP
jgi:hypothetical protein